MKRFLSSVVLASFCAVQAAPMEEFSKAIGNSDVAVVKSLLKQNTLTETEALELLNEAECALHIFEKTYWKAWDSAAISSTFLFGLGTAHTLASSIASRDRLFLSATGLTLTCLSLYSWYTWKKEEEPKNRALWTNAIVIQRLLYKASLDASITTKIQL